MLVEHKEHKEEDESIGYIESIFSSDNVLQSTYFPKNQRLYIAFNRGHMYSYENITQEMFNEFENSDSQGKYFYKNINNKSKYPCRKEYKLYPDEVKVLKETVEEFKNNLEENSEEDGDE